MSERRSDDRRAPAAEIVHEEHGHRGSFHIDRDGVRLAKMTYSRANARLEPGDPELYRDVLA